MSIVSVYSNAAWAAALGGVSIPLLSDFHPKGAVASSMGCYLDQAGITDLGRAMPGRQRGAAGFSNSSRLTLARMNAR